ERSITLDFAFRHERSAVIITIFLVSVTIKLGLLSAILPARESRPRSSWPIFRRICAASLPTLRTNHNAFCDQSTSSFTRILLKTLTPPSSLPGMTTTNSACSMSIADTSQRFCLERMDLWSDSIQPERCWDFSKNGIAQWEKSRSQLETYSRFIPTASPRRSTLPRRSSASSDWSRVCDDIESQLHRVYWRPLSPTFS